ncbi:MAG TPA: serine/threonine-protein kinase [Candidatus Acidoferrales bacterium]|jgi:serine/threonine protein kinase|nr:serine/threonine-protein kinase [Candidatus Acidoferrales bacterium]
MAQPTNSSRKLPPASDDRRRVEPQETLLLTDVPEASAMIPVQPAPVDAKANIHPATLAALSQRYDILAEAGHGSMGNVYKARDRETGEVVALKLLKPDIASDQTMMERFKNELLFARKITHKNVCRVHEFNRIGGIAYTSMEFVEGESLRSVLNRFGGLPPRKAIDLVAQICSGLKEAHAQGIVHRDLKPENVMIDTQGNVKIMDFGIARSMEALTRLTGSMVGTPAYMAPEQVGGKPVDYRTDIYSLGLIMYEVFTGAQAFQADNAVAVALKQMREAPVPPHEIEPAIPVGIERAILKCLEKEPSKRFQSIGELESAMRATGSPAREQAAAPALAPHHSSHAPLLSQFPHPPPADPKRTSPVTWVLLGALLVIGAFAGWHWMQVVQSAENLPAPAALPAPAPPDFAFDVTATQPAPAPPATSEPADAKSDADKPAEQNSETLAPIKRAPAQPVAAQETAPAKNQTPEAAAAPRNVPRHTDQAFGENEPVAGPPVNDHTPSYLWIGRFEREEKAQSTAKKIEELGLPVVVVPRHGATGEFFVVLTGPYGPERIESAMDWLKTQGFADVRLVKNPLGNQRQTPN